MKLFQLTLPNEQHGKVVSVLQDELKLDNVTSVEARTSSIVTFRVEDGEMQAILNKLQRMGVGVQFGFCDVMSLTPGTTMRQRNRNKNKKRNVGRILERNTDVGTAVPVAEMYAHIEANSTLSRDSVVMLLISSSIAGIGLAGDSGTYVVASMLLSPMMGPILGCAFGFVLRDKNLFINGMVNELFALTITFLLGIMIGAFLSPYAVALNWPTGEMRERGQAIQLLFGAIVAALSGTGVALAESNANISSVVGVAIAAALLPPTVNCGICFSYVMIGQYFVTDDVIGEEQKLVFYEIAVGSLMLLWINVVLIYVTAVLVFKIKKVDQFQLIRRIDEGAWQNLPRVQRSPAHRNAATNQHFDKRERVESSSSANSTRGFLTDDDDFSPTQQKEELKLAPMRRRPQPLLNMDEMDMNGNKADVV
ncbi:putative transcription elongation factor SPT5 [Phytophthora cinnamomi]|uniref:putative transcription elongation factor SPT5 n=1 Tax=Phytophthora cinnamomi TaxID=4785 RepID=UPI00355A6A16|nr:putative transcription elongation factor SPT5 [Phytophthora cinnamomi]